MGKRRRRREREDRSDDYEDREDKNNAGGIAGGGSMQVEFAEFIDKDRDSNVAESGEEGDPMILSGDEERSVSVELGSTDPEVIEDEFNINLDDTDTIEKANKAGELEEFEQYERMPISQQRKLKKALKEKHGERAVDKVVDNMSSWKGSRTGTKSGRLELTAKRGLGIQAPTRNNDIIEPLSKEVEVFRDYTRVSQAMIKKRTNDNGKLKVHRGLRDQKSAHIGKQIIENPNSDSYSFKTATMDNFSGIERVSQGFSGKGGFVASTEVEPDEVAMFTDGLRAGTKEDEIAVVGGVLSASSDDIKTGGNRKVVGEDGYSATEIGNGLENPSEASEEVHSHIGDMLRNMNLEGVKIEDEQSKQRLESWVDSLNNNSDISSGVRSKADIMVGKLIDDDDYTV